MITVKHHQEQNPDGSIVVVLDEDYVVESIFGPDREPYVVKAGFRSDGASIPPIFWVFIGPPLRGPYAGPCLVHDMLCNAADSYGKRVVADGVLLCLLNRIGLAFPRRCGMYAGVRIYAMYYWSVGRHLAAFARKVLAYFKSQ